MGGIFSKPSTPTVAPPPPPPTAEANAEEIKAAKTEERRRRSAAQGRQSTILTGGMGTQDASGASKKTLLGA